MAWGRKSQSAQSREILPLWLLKCGLRAPEIVKIGNFSYKFAQAFDLQNLAWEGVPGPHPHAKYYRFGFKNVGLQAPKIAKC